MFKKLTGKMAISAETDQTAISEAVSLGSLLFPQLIPSQYLKVRMVIFCRVSVKGKINSQEYSGEWEHY